MAERPKALVSKTSRVERLSWVQIPPPPPFGKRLAIMTQDDIVEKYSVEYTTLTKIEGDSVQKPSVQVITKIAKALGVSVEDLLK